MNEKKSCLICLLTMIILIVTSGCFAPPASESQQTTAVVAKTPIPPDMTCRVHTVNQMGFNGTAFTFNVKNPPMFINYTVIPRNVTETKVYTNPNTKKSETRIFSSFSPSSWFEITVRDKATNEILLQDGFGERKGYPVYQTRTIKILNAGDLQIEFRGNDIQASAMIWLKPYGNFDESRLSEFSDCMYWEGHRESLVVATPTTIKGAIYTWTPENIVTQKK